MYLNVNRENNSNNNDFLLSSSIQPSKAHCPDNVKASIGKISSITEVTDFGDPTKTSTLTLDEIVVSVDFDDPFVDLVAMLFIMGEETKTENTQEMQELDQANERTSESVDFEATSKEMSTEEQYEQAESKKVITISEKQLSISTALQSVTEIDNIIINQEETGEFFRCEMLDTFLKANFGNLYFERSDGNNIPFAENHELIKEINDRCRYCKPSEIKKKILEVAQEYLEREDVCEIDADGKKRRLTPQRRKEIAEAIAKEIYSYSMICIENQKIQDQKIKTEERSSEIDGYTLVDASRFAIPLLSGSRHELELIDRTYKVVGFSALFFVMETKLILVKYEKEASDKQIDLIERVKEMLIMKDILKRENLTYEIKQFGIKTAEKNEIDVRMELSTYIIFHQDQKNPPKIVLGSKKKLSFSSQKG